MVVIRLARGGAKKRPFYHIVATDRRSRRDSHFIERLGYFNPIATGGEKRLSMKNERMDYWLSQGAQPSNRVAGLIKESVLDAPQKTSTKEATIESNPISEKITPEKATSEETAKETVATVIESESDAGQASAPEKSAE